MSTRVALQAFALAIAPLPGVRVPPGVRSFNTDGGEVVRWVMGHFDELSAAQQRAVRKALTGSPVPDTGGGGRSAPAKGAAAATVVQEMLARYDGPLGALSIPVQVFYLGSVPQGAPAGTWALAEPVNASGGDTGAAARCDVDITPVGAGKSGADFEVAIAHELFHCYQAVWLGLDRYYAPGSSWAIEGSATWAGYNVSPDPPSDANNWYYVYFATATTPLFQREHDAVGFFGQTAQWDVDLWPLFPKFFQTSGNVARYHVIADAAGDKLLDSWGPGYWLSKDLGPQWRMEGTAAPKLGSYYSKPGTISVANGSSVSVAAAPFAVGMYLGHPTADVTEVQIHGHARLADQAGFDSGELDDAFLCTKTSGSCTCPSDQDNTNGSQGLPASIQTVKGELQVGITGATDGAKGSVTGLTLDTWCKKRAKQRATNVCQLLDVSTIDDITGLHITQVKQDGDACVYGDPSAPVNGALQQIAGAISQGFTGSNTTIDTGAGLIVRLQELGPGPEPQVADYLSEIPSGAPCDQPQLVDSLNAASLVCLGGAIEDVALVGDNRYVFMSFFAAGSAATHEQGAALAHAAKDHL